MTDLEKEGKEQRKKKWKEGIEIKEGKKKEALAYVDCIAKHLVQVGLSEDILLSPGIWLDFLESQY